MHPFSRPRSILSRRGQGHILSYGLCAAVAVLATILLMMVATQPAAAQGVTPDATKIPASQTVPTVDGNCERVEYIDAVAVNFIDAFEATGTVRLKHAGGSLYVCVTAAPGTREDRFFRVYADPENGKEAFASANDLAFQVAVTTGASSAYRGTGVANGWAAAPVPGWEAKVSYSPNYESAEFRIPLNLVNGSCGKPSGLAVYHHWVSGVGDDYGWPSNKYFDKPDTWEEVAYDGRVCPIAYVFRSDTAIAAQFKTLLESDGFTVELIPLAEVLKADFTVFDLVIVARDTGYLDRWPQDTPGVSAEAAHIAAANKPVIGLGEGGYAYFGKGDQALGWPNGWHGPLAAVNPVNTGQTYWHVPYELGTPPPSPLALYADPMAEVGIYLPGVTAVLPFGREPADKDHAPLLAEEDDCDQLWGFSGPPAQMTAEGRQLFVNAVAYGLSIAGRCAPPKTPPAQCLTVTKAASPPAGTKVAVGDTITYEIKYAVANLPECAAQRATLTDKVPEGALFIPGSASDEIAPGADKVLNWNLGPMAPGATGSKAFKVEVGEAACREQQTITNDARLITSLGTATSNVVSHPVDCPPVIPDGQQPPYAEDEIQIYPYPLVTGHVTELSVRIRNLRTTARSVTVTFEMSGAQFGIGLPYGPLPVPGNPRTVVLPPLGIVEVKIHWTPVTSGHYCVRVKIDNPGDDYPPIYSQRNLDVAEDLEPGVQDDLTFAVGNPTAATAVIRLVVINTCPGWSAQVAPTELPGMAPGEIRTATLSVIPPVDRPLGTECHIDVQGWIGDRLIGGIRKLDVPPVHLPETKPRWMEREIVVSPDPPVLGVPGQLCVDLQNPLPISQTVAIQFRVAAFGAGIPFTPVGSLSGVVLPPNRITRHCIAWTSTPVSNGNLHRCIQVLVDQQGYFGQVSQRNVDLRRLRVRSLAELLALRIPFSLGNPELYPQALTVEPKIVGLRGIVAIIDPMPPFQPAGRRGARLHAQVRAVRCDRPGCLGPVCGCPRCRGAVRRHRAGRGDRAPGRSARGRVQRGDRPAGANLSTADPEITPGIGRSRRKIQEPRWDGLGLRPRRNPFQRGFAFSGETSATLYRRLRRTIWKDPCDGCRRFRCWGSSLTRTVSAMAVPAATIATATIISSSCTTWPRHTGARPESSPRSRASTWKWTAGNLWQ